MLEVRGLRVAYGGVEVLHGIDIDVTAGEVVGVIGPNGAGKSSLLRAICGVVGRDEGEITLERQPIGGRSAEEIVRAGIALVPEGRRIFGTLSVGENLRLAARGRIPGEEVYERFPILLERSRQRADRLSGGEQQQLALARALVGGPRLLLLDEPSLGLAPKMIDAIYDLLGTLRGEGMTMLLVEQNATRTIEFCDRCVVLAGGRVRAQGNREELQRNPDVLHAYLGRQP